MIAIPPISGALDTLRVLVPLPVVLWRSVKRLVLMRTEKEHLLLEVRVAYLEDGSLRPVFSEGRCAWTTYSPTGRRTTISIEPDQISPLLTLIYEGGFFMSDPKSSLRLGKLLLDALVAKVSSSTEGPASTGTESKSSP